MSEKYIIISDHALKRCESRGNYTNKNEIQEAFYKAKTISKKQMKKIKVQKKSSYSRYKTRYWSRRIDASLEVFVTKEYNTNKYVLLTYYKVLL